MTDHNQSLELALRDAERERPRYFRDWIEQRIADARVPYTASPAPRIPVEGRRFPTPRMMERAQRQMRATTGWHNFFVNRGRVAYNPTERELRMISHRRML